MSLARLLAIQHRVNDMIEIQIDDKSSTEQSSQLVETDGYLLLYLKEERIQMQGNMDLAALTPLLTKIVMKKMAG